MFSYVEPTSDEIGRELPGDALVPSAQVIMDRAFTVAATPEDLWPWFVQLGKSRAGWYLPRSVERFVLPSKKALRHIEPSLQNLQVGSVIDDWGGRHATFEVAQFEPNQALVHISTRGNTHLSWAIVLQPQGAQQTRVQLRLRLSAVKFAWIAHSLGGFFDLITVAGLAKGLNERVHIN